MSLEQLGEYIYERPEIISGIAAGIGLFFTAQALRHQQKRDQTIMIESVFKDIRELEKELAQIPPNNPTEIVDVNHRQAMEDWDSRFFNTLEWLSFLINSREVKSKKLINYFKPSIIAWYEQVFLRHADKITIEDPDQYEELKKLYRKLKGQSSSSFWRMKHEVLP